MIMQPNQGRLQTGEHILAKLIEIKIPDSKVIIAKFDKDNGRVDFSSQSDFRNLNKEELEKEVNFIIKKNLKVNKLIISRKEAEKIFNLDKIPVEIREIRIVDISGFDSRPCRDPHVDNTQDIGYFQILKITREGKERYRITFKVE